MTGPADLLFVNGDVLTVDAEFSVAQAVAVREGRILAVGETAEIEALAGPHTRVIDLAGRTLLPGINDSHLHAAAWGLTRPPFALAVGHPAVRSIADIAESVRQAAATTPAGEWITGLGWDLGYLAECLDDSGRRPHRRDLDAVSPDHPVGLTDFSGHMLWVNSKALEIAGITRDTSPPPGGVIDVDAAGEPTGLLREGAMSLVQRHLPPATVELRKQAIRSAVAALHAEGITSYTEPGLGPGGVEILGGGLSTESLEAYVELARAGELDARVRVLLLPAPMGGSAADVTAGLRDLAAIPSEVDPELLAVIGVKIFADGVPPNETAWMHEAYGAAGGHGSLCVHGADAALQQAELTEMVRIAHAAGYQVGVHATGDRTIDAVTDAFITANRAHPRPDARHYLIHADFTSEETLAKLAEHGYSVNMQPAIKWTIADLMDEVVGKERSDYQWPVRSAAEAGLAVCASSDAPITEPNWRQGVAAMLLRESRATGRPSGPEQCVDLATAIRAYTINAARQDFAESWKGSIEVGKVADLCVLGGDLRAIDPHDIPTLPIDLTVLGGEIVFDRQTAVRNVAGGGT
ncbi:amidohydrolase [Sphaerimonospora thailandensis]|uniref:Amidohydrolase n=1 Tax=Sphaerimonospora thailandensis TaxID=795644 RepID=A0A8J3REX2_9ACTN|nr:amidohydrolase [Sphaerimonospora thailandensis]GIH73011.1 amidohydrolase [Sphaerimonospora thailandensis]